MDIIECNLSEQFETVEVFPLSDLHVGSSTTDYAMFDKFIKHILAAPNRFIIYNGDNINNGLKDSKTNVYGESMRPREQKKWLINALMPVRERILVLVEGNHENRSAKETDQSVVEDIAEALGKPYSFREDEAYLKLTFGKRSGNGRRQVYCIYVTHGAGGGGTPGAAMNKAEKVALGTEADCYVFGHVHKKMAYKNAYRYVDLSNNKITERERLFVVSSHWMSFGGYAAKLMLTPSAKGSVPITLYAKEKRMEAII